MAPDVIDLISSSPPPAAHCTPRPPLAPSLRYNSLGPQVSGPRDTSIKKRNRRPTHHELQDPVTYATGSEVLEDFNDFDSFDDFDDAILDSLGEQEAKRRRVDQQHDGQNDSSKSQNENKPIINAAPPVLIGKARHCPRPALEAIEFTSSLECVSPKNGEKENRRHLSRCAPSAKGSASHDQIPLSSDPFASSPRCIAERQTKHRRAVSLDLVISSSSPMASTTQDRPSDRQIGCSGYTSVHAASHTRCLRYRERSDDESDPFADTPISDKRTHSKAIDEPICIDDSDLSDASNDDELPSILDMDLSKRSARSPIRRSQSDLIWLNRKSSAPRSKQTSSTKTIAERQAEKQKRQQQREELKAVKAAEKHRAAALAELNKVRTDKKVSTPEMIVDLPSGLSPELQVQIQEMLKGLGVEHFTWNSPSFNMIKWRRKVTSKFNEDLGLWEPIPHRISDEDIAVVILTAEEFVAMALEETLAAHVTDITSQHHDKKLIYILQGIDLWLRKNRNIRNRQFASGVRSANGEASSTSRGAAAAAAEHISESIIEDAMLLLQVEHDMLIHHTAAAAETARWVINFTQHISTIPYKKQRDQATSVAGFCMETGQVRTGDDVRDTYVRMLQEIVRVTAPIAYGIVAEFDTVTKLVNGLERGGPGRLDAVRKSSNKDGAMSDRTIGPAVSRRMHKVFTGRDENSTDV
ncbi:hypothetical protein QQS21_001948 [Conoideocrella luteorostrata]|uniref:ERCC4 domain-containing protein n=1 Tax=Conoideocrella luteorostrata TaxID=1105319 RepID=A0AAJ0FXQ0_9HYPO|nr:hypothetical protein QQS21_001948 [Conoideocrella luteorostrata]